MSCDIPILTKNCRVASVLANMHSFDFHHSIPPSYVMDFYVFYYVNFSMLVISASCLRCI